MRALALLLILLTVAGCKKKEYAVIGENGQVTTYQQVAQPVRRSDVTVEDLGYYSEVSVLRITNSATGAECYGTVRAMHCNFPTKP